MQFQDRRSGRILLRELSDYRYGLRDIRPKPGQVSAFLDIGANAGMLSIHARLQLPQARVCSVDPDPNTYACLCHNTENMGIELLQAGLGVSGTKLNIARGHKTSVARRYVAAEAGIPAYTLPELLSHFKLDPATTWLKCDCEGGEWTMVGDSGAEDALAQMPCLGFEVHIADATKNIQTFKTWLDTILGKTHNKVQDIGRRKLGNIVYVRKDILI